MSADTHQSDHPLHAVFSICASPDVARAATEACGDVPNSEFIGEFHDYFTPERRPQLPPTVKGAAGCVAVVDCDRDPERALVTMERLRTMQLKNLNVVGYSTRMEAEYLLRAMRAGCNEFLGKPAESKVLQDALVRFENAQLLENTSKDVGRIVTLYGAKGGVGTTALGVHLAVNLVRRHQKRTLLIDHKHELGHAALYLGMKDSPYHFDELVRNADRLDADLLNGFVVRHPSGLEVLTSPDIPSHNHKSTAGELDLVLNFLRTQYDFILIDSSLEYREIVSPMLRYSDEIAIIVTPDVASLRNLARQIEHFNLNEETSRKLRVVINRSGSEDAVSAEQIESIVHHPVWAKLPNAYAEVMRAINSGEPLPPQHRSQFAQQISKWADKIASANTPQDPQTQTAKKRFSLWGAKREQLA